MVDTNNLGVILITPKYAISNDSLKATTAKGQAARTLWMKQVIIYDQQLMTGFRDCGHRCGERHTQWYYQGVYMNSPVVFADLALLTMGVNFCCNRARPSATPPLYLSGSFPSLPATLN